MHWGWRVGIGAATGVAIGAGGGLIETAINGNWDNVGINMLNSAAGKFTTDAIFGAVSGE